MPTPTCKACTYELEYKEPWKHGHDCGKDVQPSKVESVEEITEILKMLDESRLCGRRNECGEWHGLCPENVSVFARKVKDEAYAQGRASMKKDIEAAITHLQNK